MSDRDPQQTQPTQSQSPADPGEPTGDQGPQEPAEKDWREEADKWKTLSRKHEREAKQAAARVAEFEDKDKTEAEKAAKRAAAAEQAAGEAQLRADRLEVALAKGLPHALAKRLSGGSREELEADADELLETFGAAAGAKPRPAGAPRENLRGGGEPGQEPSEMDPRKLAEGISRW